jgi:hypothetical protein
MTGLTRTAVRVSLFFDVRAGCGERAARAVLLLSKGEPRK